MAEDFNALVADLTTNARYDAAVVAGRNSEIESLLNEIEPEIPGPGNKTVIQDVSREEALVAFGDEMDALTSAQTGRLQLIVGESGTVKTSRAEIRARLVNIFGGAGTPPIARITAAATRDATYGDAFGYPQVGLNTVRKAVRLIAKSFIVTTGQV